MVSIDVAFTLNPEIEAPLDKRTVGTVATRNEITYLYNGLVRYETNNDNEADLIVYTDGAWDNVITVKSSGNIGSTLIQRPTIEKPPRHLVTSKMVLDAGDDNNQGLVTCQGLINVLSGGVGMNGAPAFWNISDQVDLDLQGKKCLFANVYASLTDLPSANQYHGMFAHVHATGAAYFAHNGNWVEIATQDELNVRIPPTAGQIVSSPEANTVLILNASGNAEWSLYPFLRTLKYADESALPTLPIDGTFAIVENNGAPAGSAYFAIQDQAENHHWVKLANAAQLIEIQSELNVRIPTTAGVPTGYHLHINEAGFAEWSHYPDHSSVAVYADESSLPTSPTDGTFALIDAGSAYFARNGAWVKLANAQDLTGTTINLFDFNTNLLEGLGDPNDASNPNVPPSLDNLHGKVPYVKHLTDLAAAFQISIQELHTLYGDLLTSHNILKHDEVGADRYDLTGTIWTNILYESEWTGRLSGHSEVRSLHARLVELEDKNLDHRITYNFNAVNSLDGVINNLPQVYHPLQDPSLAYGKAPRIVVNSIYGDDAGSFYHFTASQSKIDNEGSTAGGMKNYHLYSKEIKLYAHGDQGDYHGRILCNTYRGIFQVEAVEGEIRLNAHHSDLLLYGTIKHNGNVVSSYSDDRLKHNEYEITNALETMRKLKPIRYQQTRKPFASDYTGDLSGVDHWEAAGFIAQDVKKDIPELEYCVNQNTEHNDFYSLNYMNIMIHAIQAIKELDAKNQALEARIVELENSIS